MAEGPIRVKGLFWRLPAAWRLLRSPAQPMWGKVLLVAAGAYVVMPLDLIPDVAAIIGWLDDLGVVAAVALVLNRQLHKFALPEPEAPPPTAPR